MRKEVNETLVAAIAAVLILAAFVGFSASRATDPTFAPAVTYEASRQMPDNDENVAPVTYTYNGVERLGYVEGDFASGQEVSIVVTPETGEPNYGETGLGVAVLVGLLLALIPTGVGFMLVGTLAEAHNKRARRRKYRHGSVYHRAMDTVRSV